MTLEKLKNHSGKPVRCLIGNKIISDCIILHEPYYQYYRFHLCQNLKDGRHGVRHPNYSYSWAFRIPVNASSNNFDEVLKAQLYYNGIKDLELL